MCTENLDWFYFALRALVILYSLTQPYGSQTARTFGWAKINSAPNGAVELF
ncbi:MAG: hypothetical protein ACD_69C00163G0004 [uncultured bacterium]|nr:MAG: hypothetical protein ACD_69C00163G0004 [uncultured bacterium]